MVFCFLAYSDFYNLLKIVNFNERLSFIFSSTINVLKYNTECFKRTVEKQSSPS